MELIEKVVRDFLLGDVPSDQGETFLNDDDNLFEKGLIDSIRLFKLVSFLEERFGIAIPDGDVIADNFQSVNTIKDLLRSKLP